MFKYFNKKIKNYKWQDITLVKLTVLFFTLMIAKLWPGILGLNWYVYMILAIIFMIRPMIMLLKK
jgi:hypothetical protein